jgi:hypothetical protein
MSSIVSQMSHALLKRAPAGKNAVKPIEVENKDGNYVNAIDDAHYGHFADFRRFGHQRGPAVKQSDTYICCHFEATKNCMCPQ